MHTLGMMRDPAAANLSRCEAHRIGGGAQPGYRLSTRPIKKHQASTLHIYAEREMTTHLKYTDLIICQFSSIY